jgi:hypothetical protein
MIRFDGAPTCSDRCAVRLEPVVTLGPHTPDGRPVILSEFPLVHQDGEGRYYVGDWSSGEVFVYSADGTYLAAFGREGEGPGEFKGFAGVIDLPGDTILAVDYALGRLSTFGPDWEYVRSVRTEALFARPAVRMGDVLIVNPGRSFQRFGRSPIQALDLEGRVVRGVGPPAQEDREHPLATLRALAPYSSDAFAAGYTGRYRIEVWALDGTLRRVLERSIPEFSEERDTECSTTWVPSPSLTAIQAREARGELLVMLSIGDRKWRDGVEQVGFEGPCSFSVTDPDLVYDTWIEVWDLTRGEVTTRAVYERPFAGFVGPGLVGRVEYVADNVVYRVYRLEVGNGRE